MLDYTKQKKNYLNVKLADGKILLLGVPKKSLFTQLSSVQEALSDTDEIATLYDELLSLSSEILSNNKTAEKFTPEDVDRLMDIEDMALLIREYSKFAGTIVSNPN